MELAKYRFVSSYRKAKHTNTKKILFNEKEASFIERIVVLKTDLFNAIKK